MSSLELVRWADYADLGILFGVPAAAALVRADAMLSPMRWMLCALAMIALPLALLRFLLVAAEMTGTGLGELDWELVSYLVRETPLGWAFFARMAALAAAISVSIRPVNGLPWLAIPAGAAVASLAWSGHAAAGEGASAALRLGGDIVHLLAASTWIGALALFLVMLVSSRTFETQLAAALSRFAGIGSVLVLVLVVTGIGNMLFLIELSRWSTLPIFHYGYLLTIKLALFAVMLGFAGMNRFALVPRLTNASSPAQSRATIRALKISIAMELVAGLAVIAIVSRLGLLDPAGT